MQIIAYLTTDASSSQYKRRGRQFLFPTHVWSHYLGIPNSDRNQFPSLIPYQYHPSVVFQIATPAEEGGKFSQQYEKTSPNHATFYSGATASAIIPSLVPCNTRDNELGICKSFTDCFPMVKIQYGSADYTDYMDVPLAEQLILNTNETVCSQSRCNIFFKS